MLILQPVICWEQIGLRAIKGGFMSCSVLLLALSLHLNTSVNYNEVHPGLGVECNTWSAGAYKNSIKENSVWAARRFKKDTLFLETGVVTGYDYKGKDVLPFLRAGVDLKYVDLFIVPGVELNRVIPVLGMQFKY